MSKKLLACEVAENAYISHCDKHGCAQNGINNCILAFQLREAWKHALNRRLARLAARSGRTKPKGEPRTVAECEREYARILRDCGRNKDHDNQDRRFIFAYGFFCRPCFERASAVLWESWRAPAIRKCSDCQDHNCEVGNPDHLCEHCQADRDSGILPVDLYAYHVNGFHGSVGGSDTCRECSRLRSRIEASKVGDNV